jgi:hypothetical protein
MVDEALVGLFQTYRKYRALLFVSGAFMVRMAQNFDGSNSFVCNTPHFQVAFSTTVWSNRRSVLPPLPASLEPDILVGFLDSWTPNDAKTHTLDLFVAGSSLFSPRRICRGSGSATDFFDG